MQELQVGDDLNRSGRTILDNRVVIEMPVQRANRFRLGCHRSRNDRVVIGGTGNRGIKGLLEECPQQGWPFEHS
jgi:hypothetical protein